MGPGGVDNLVVGLQRGAAVATGVDPVLEAGAEAKVEADPARLGLVHGPVLERVRGDEVDVAFVVDGPAGLEALVIHSLVGRGARSRRADRDQRCQEPDSYEAHLLSHLLPVWNGPRMTERTNGGPVAARDEVNGQAGQDVLSVPSIRLILSKSERRVFWRGGA